MTLTARSFVIPTLSRIGSIRCDTAGSPTHPSAREAIVMPTWQTERWASRSRNVSRHHRSLGIAFLFKLLNARFPHPYQRELRRHEETIQYDKKERREKVQPG